MIYHRLLRSSAWILVNACACVCAQTYNENSTVRGRAFYFTAEGAITDLLDNFFPVFPINVIECHELKNI